jgi:phage shock protein PspC (stress-responsive transcriptional regulator)
VPPYQEPPLRNNRSLHRSANDKIIGGVAAGLAHYFRIDPSIVRLLFIIIFFMGGSGFLLYIILWIVLPSRYQENNVRKRLYRNPENKMIGGVSSGIAAFLNIDVWIPRVIFLSPFIFWSLASFFSHGWWDFNPVPHFLFNGFGGSLFIIYIVLWIVLPEATTSTEKLEMRGEKVDLESIKKTVKEDLENLKGRTEKFGAEVKDRATEFGQEVKVTGQSFASYAAPVVRRSGSRLGHAIGVIFKAFFLFIAGIISLALLAALFTLLFSGMGMLPVKDFILDGPWQNILALSTLVLFLGVPIIALLTWLIRRLIGVRSRSYYLGYIFGTLWIIGVVSAVMLGGLIARDFRTKTSVREEYNIAQPSTGKLLVKVTEGSTKYYGNDWMEFDDDWPFYIGNEDSVMLNSVRLKLIRSNDSSYHAYAVKFSNGATPALAENLSEKIIFGISQNDSMLYLPKGFPITQEDKFRNQQVMMVIEIPEGKKIQIHKNVEWYDWFDIQMNRRRGWNIDWDDRWNNNFYWKSNREYIMTPGGLEETSELEKKKKEAQESGTDSIEDGRYRYKNRKDLNTTPDSIRATSIVSNAAQVDYDEDEDDEINAEVSPKPLFTFLMTF